MHPTHGLPSFLPIGRGDGGESGDLSRAALAEMQWSCGGERSRRSPSTTAGTPRRQPVATTSAESHGEPRLPEAGSRARAWFVLW